MKSVIVVFLMLKNIFAAQDLSGVNSAQQVEEEIHISSSSQSLTDEFFIKTTKDVTKQLDLYKKYFMSVGNHTEEEALQDFLAQPTGVTEEKRAEEVIFTLTSYPARFETTWLAIESMLRQTVRPDRISLNLFEDEFPSHVLPWFVRQQMTRGLEINWYPENLKVYLKIIPAIQKFPEASVVAVDDDVIYPSNRLGDLIEGHKEYPDTVICSDGRIVRTVESFILPVSKWHFTGWYPSSQTRRPNTDIIPEGVFGVLIPPHTWHEDFTKKDLFFGLCPTDDDLWTYAMTVHAGKKVAKIARTSQPLVNVDGSQEVESTLWKTNTANRSEKLTQYAFDMFAHYNLTRFFPGKIPCLSFYDVKVQSLSKMRYNQSFPIQHADLHNYLPLDLVSSFGYDEIDGIWSLGSKSTFRIYANSPGSLYRIVFHGSPYIHPVKGNSSVQIRSANEVQELKASYNFREGHSQSFSFLTRIDGEYELFEMHTPDFVKPCLYGDTPENRECAIYMSKFGVYKVIPELLDINMGASFDLRSPVYIGKGFHGMEKSGLWSSNNSEFSFAFPEKDQPYRFNIYCQRTFLESGSCDVMQNGLSLVHADFTKEKPLNILSFDYTPAQEVSNFSLRITGGNPKTLGHSQDYRNLGMFMTRIAVEKK